MYCHLRVACMDVPSPSAIPHDKSLIVLERTCGKCGGRRIIDYVGDKVRAITYDSRYDRFAKIAEECAVAVILTSLRTPGSLPWDLSRVFY